jgi:hypothetical protein
MSVVPPGSSWETNEAGIHLFVFGGIVHTIGSDVLIGFLWKSVPFPSKLMTGTGATLSILHLLVRYWVPFEAESPHKRVVWSITSSFHILGTIAMELKLGRIGFDLPKHAVRMVRRSE